MEEKYLYGASVQGIQGFIFQTNKLIEIAGASELVEQICFKAFEEYVKDEKEKDENWIVRAAGKILYVFENKENCRKAVLEFPRKVMKMAPGITISQAVVRIKGDLSDYGEQSDELEKRLRVQRNKAVRSQTLGLMAIKRAPSTGLPAVEEVGKEYGGGNEKELIDEASASKKKMKDSIDLARKAFGEEVTEKKITNEIDKIAGKNSWIAVIHADGNGLGNIVQRVGKNAKEMRDFSLELDKITKMSARRAFGEVKKDYFKDDIIPIRPIVLGGDDVTVICKADFAVEYTKIFLEAFEEESKKLGENRLTACAGIAYVKSSYPFHYAVDLAEKLCGRAKKEAKKIDKDLAPSCLMFHKVEDSFITDIEEIKSRMLTPQEKTSFEFGPYYCGEHAKTKGSVTTATIGQLIKNVKELNGNEGSAIKSHLRQWLATLFDDVEMANQKMKRIISIGDPQVIKKLELEKYQQLLKIDNQQVAENLALEKYQKLLKNGEISIPFYDILSLCSVSSFDSLTEKNIQI
ncbi:hypothetical protein EZS27_011217 [termite gut metagenome]|uniref:Cas10/Cmr2 second palm domain-containing protein n=1 Tax=termite gut metagenome TaxID=433724 RepID=A0A5J4S551_9ZZZZ